MRDQCTKFDSCAAPICPLSADEENNNYIWYSDEEVCNRHNKLFIKNQKKIVKVNNDHDKYYTFKMLNQNCVIGSGMQGINPDQGEELQLKTWFKKHPMKREISDTEKQKRLENMKNMLQAKKEGKITTENII